MPHHETRYVEIREFVLRTFASHAGLSFDRLRADDPTLTEVIALSPGMTNSIDLMESFARTSNSFRKEYGARVRLPALPLDTPLSAVVAAFIEEYARQEEDKEPVA